MTQPNSTSPPLEPPSAWPGWLSTDESRGFALGLLAVLWFSMSVPMTRVASPELGWIMAGLGRAVIAGALAVALLTWRRERFPGRQYLPGLMLVALGVVVGFPVFTAIALRDLPSAHGVVIVGLLPAATAGMAVLRAGERMPLRFWLAVGAGVVSVLIFAAAEGAGRPRLGDLWLLLAVLLAALGYAEGGRMARELGGWRVISWALVISLPVLIIPVGWTLLTTDVAGSPKAWVALGYLSVISMFLGFFIWYRGLVLGGVARVGQAQLVQPVLSLLWSALLLGEHIGLPTMMASFLVIGSVVLTRRAGRRR